MRPTAAALALLVTLVPLAGCGRPDEPAGTPAGTVLLARSGPSDLDAALVKEAAARVAQLDAEVRSAAAQGVTTEKVAAELLQPLDVLAHHVEKLQYQGGVAAAERFRRRLDELMDGDALPNGLTRSWSASITVTIELLMELLGFNDRIAFVSDRTGFGEVYTMTPSGGGVRRITDLRGSVRRPVWSPDRARLAFASNHEGGDWEIFTVGAARTTPATRSDLVRLTNRAGVDDSPAWSPDGRRIAFVSDRFYARQQVWTMNAADGSDVLNVTFISTGGIDPAWSPGADSIAYATGSSGGHVVYMIRVPRDAADDLRASRRISPLDGDNVEPAWSPDGSRVAYARALGLGSYDVYASDTRATTHTALVTGAGDDRAPAWSRDGRRLAFESRRTGNREIFVLTLATGAQANATNDPLSDERPAWRP